MPVRPILKFPDPRLGQAAERVEVFDDTLRRLADDLLETLRSVSGVGITAPHVGVALRLVVFDMPGARSVRVYANPKLVGVSDETSRHMEGSISMPGVAEEVERPARVTVAYQDVDGVERREGADGFFAACHQHEIDQLDGIFWLRRLSSLKRERAVRGFRKLQRRGEAKE